MSRSNSAILTFGTAGIVFEWRWIPWFAELFKEVTWSNVWLFMIFSGMMFATAFIGGKIGQFVCRRSPHRTMLFNPEKFDVLKIGRYGQWFYLGGILHYSALIVAMARPDDLLLGWINIVLFVLAKVGNFNFGMGKLK